MVDPESVWIEIGGIGLGIIENLDIRSFNHLASEQVVSRVISSVSTVLLTTTVCSQDFLDTSAPPKMDTNLVVNSHCWNQ